MLAHKLLKLDLKCRENATCFEANRYITVTSCTDLYDGDLTVIYRKFHFIINKLISNTENNDPVCKVVGLVINITFKIMYCWFWSQNS